MNIRLQQFLAAENITQAQLADSLNVARAGVSHILAGRNKPSYDFLSALMLHFPRLNVEWLMFGKGKMYKDTSEPLVHEQPAIQSELLFDDEDDFQDEIHATHVEKVVNIEATDRIKNLDNTVQTAVKQRNVKKIIVLFDDGSFQEM